MLEVTKTHGGIRIEEKACMHMALGVTAKLQVDSIETD